MTFEPFTLTCYTCGSRLRVTNPALVGTIANCPKCGSMVQIDPPQMGPAIAVGGDSVDSDTMTRDAVPEPPETNGDAPVPSGFQSPATDDVDPGPVSGGDAVPPAWQSEQTERVRHIALVVALAAGGLIVAAIMFGWFVHSWQQRSSGDNALASVEANDASAKATEPVEPSETNGPLPAIDDTDPSGEELEEETTSASSKEEDGAGSKTAPGDESGSDTPSQLADSNEQGEGASSTGAGGTDAEQQSSGEKLTAMEQKDAGLSNLLPKSPLQGLTSPVTPGFAGDPEDEADETQGLVDLPPGLKQFMPFTEFGAKPKDPTPEIEAPPTIDQLDIKEAAEEVVDPMMAAEGPVSVDLSRSLAMEIGFYSEEGYPLSDFALVISQLTGAPIEIDWLTFDLAGKEIRANVPIGAEMVPAANQLGNAAAALGGEVELQESYALVTLNEKGFRDSLAKLVSLDDFADHKSSATRTLQDFLQVDVDDEGKLQLDDERVQKQLAGVASEALRRMRGLPGKVSDEALGRWATSVASPQPWQPLKGGESGPQPDTAITISQLLRQVARLNDATVVINWDDVLRRQLAPDELVMPYTGDDAARMLERVLSPYELQIREVSPGYWWLGTEATYDRLPVVVWTEPLGDEKDSFLRRLNAVMGDAGPNVYRVTYDPQSDRALLMIPRFILRQLDEIIDA